MSDPATDGKDPSAPASQNAGRLPKMPYHQVLAGQPALVTGANSGIGRAVALGLSRASADGAINDVTEPAAAEELAHDIEAMGRRAITLFVDGGMTLYPGFATGG